MRGRISAQLPDLPPGPAEPAEEKKRELWGVRGRGKGGFSFGAFSGENLAGANLRRVFVWRVLCGCANLCRVFVWCVFLGEPGRCKFV